MLLPIENPPITSDPQYADILSTVLPRKGGREWYYGNFIQLFVDFTNVERGELRFREHLFAINKIRPTFWYDYIPFVKSINGIDDTTMMIGNENIVDKFKEIIDSGYYIITFIDRHFLDSRYVSGFIHNMLIYGYDETAFYISDFVSDSGQYIFTKIEFEKVYRSFCEIYDIEKFPHIDFPKKTVMFKITDCDYKLDAFLIKKLLEDYLLERNTTESYECILDLNSHGKKASWGLACITYYIDYLISLGEPNEPLDLKYTSLLRDHKEAMLERLKFFLSIGLMTNESFLEHYQNIKNQTEICLLLGLKFNRTGDAKFITQIISRLQNVYDMEKDVLPKILDDFR